MAVTNLLFIDLMIHSWINQGIQGDKLLADKYCGVLLTLNFNIIFLINIYSANFARDWMMISHSTIRHWTSGTLVQENCLHLMNALILMKM